MVVMIADRDDWVSRPRTLARWPSGPEAWRRV